MKFRRSFKVKLLLLITTLLYYIKLKRTYIRKRWRTRRWVIRPINQLRKEHGEFYNLFKELKNDDKMFFKYSRLNLQHFQKLLQLLRPSLTKKNKRAICPEQRLIILLRYLATGNSTSSLAFSFRIGQSTVRNIIKETCVAIVNTLRQTYLKCPTENEWKNIVEGYWKRWNMPNCFGAIDGKHILLRCPPNSGSLFFNYKKQFSIVLLAVSDDLYKFSLVDIGSYGGNSDGGIFEHSNIGINLKNNNLNLPKSLGRLPNSDIILNGYFIADSAFPLSINLMKPYSGNNLSEEQQIYNYRLSRARRTVESAFGIFANRWRDFHTPICVLPTTADYITITGVILHNYVMCEEQKDNLKKYSQKLYCNEELSYDWIDTQHPHNSNIATAISQRDILKEYFTSSGIVAFQQDYVHRGQYSEY